ncbi:cryptochrome/deoxyribodipyrimidine photo-lyase family protein [Neolewinella antarctica]|uniref:Deoxyribodipyrimidine photo-lyase n=1 Tax=Neolewinella antarctica TaxID=442734 RepID=A0ABX0X8W5_9BACT|nr:FAD-binding domain-containing protein [Neolewinella antarctica]NJC25703.1 deoxyribodipyrimidine photo-lyase [Neolewinella antarctica]
MEKPIINIVWLKRDLRTRDHAPLAAAVAAGLPFVMLYCFEPSIMASPKQSPRHWRFVAQSLEDLRGRGWPVVSWWGEVTEALEAINLNNKINTIYCHQETGHKLTFDRDKIVFNYCRDRSIDVIESVQDAAIRGRKHRNGFGEHVDDFLARPPVPGVDDKSQVFGNETLMLPTAVVSDGFTTDFTQAQTEIAVSPTKPGYYEPIYVTDTNFQPGGETNAWRYLRSFTAERGKWYAYKLGSPTLSRTSCSRMSTYLAYGCVSVRQVFQWAKRVATEHPAWAYDLKMFRERLWWRAHYFQKLEAEWQIEGRPINLAFLELHRTSDHALLDAFKNARTGFPIIDANIRCLKATGWINFRSRAMLVTFATFVCWLDWRPIATFLGSLFLDYEPGIHYGQFQMQAGLTGYHPPRNYNPYTQGDKYDADGAFVHQWIPELRTIPAPFCHYPYRMTAMEQSMYGLNDLNYPAPVVDYSANSKVNMDRYWEIRHSEAAQGNLVGIWLKHVLPESRAEYMRGVDPSPRRDV